MGTKKKEALIKFHRDTIISAAKQLFEEKGIEQTKVDDIALMADYSKSTLYVYFKSKEEIISHITYEQFKQLKKILVDCIEKKSGFEDCYYLICAEMTAYQEKHPLYYKLIMNKIEFTKQSSSKPDILNDIYRIGEEINVILKTFLEKAIDEGHVRPDIKLIPTVLYLGSALSEAIHYASEKEDYLKCLGMTKQDYMKNCFDLILISIRR